MRTIRIGISVIAVAAFLAGCAAHDERVLKRATQTVAQNFVQVDTDNDGKLSKAELNAFR